MRWLALELDAHQEKPAIVVVHHNPPKLTDAPQLLALLDERKQVKALFHGHRHRWGLDRTAGGVHLVNLLPVSYPSPKWPAPAASGWVLAQLSADAVRLQVRCIDQKHPLHESFHHLQWRPG